MVLTNTNNLCLEQEYEKYQNFLSENFPFLVVKFSIYLNRRVFVMKIKQTFQNKHNKVSSACILQLNDRSDIKRGQNSLLQIKHFFKLKSTDFFFFFFFISLRKKYVAGTH